MFSIILSNSLTRGITTYSRHRELPSCTYNSSCKNSDFDSQYRAHLQQSNYYWISFMGLGHRKRSPKSRKRDDNTFVNIYTTEYDVQLEIQTIKSEAFDVGVDENEGFLSSAEEAKLWRFTAPCGRQYTKNGMQGHRNRKCWPGKRIHAPCQKSCLFLLALGSSWLPPNSLTAQPRLQFPHPSQSCVSASLSAFHK